MCNTSHADGILATKPSNTFSMAFKKMLEGLVKNRGIIYLNVKYPYL